MPHELLWTEEADDAMSALEDDPDRALVLSAVRRTLGRIELDPHDPRLGTRMFVSEGFEHVRATPARFENWWVLWSLDADAQSVIVRHVGMIDL